MKSKKVKDENMDINPYEMDKLSKVPSWLKILLLKYWAAAAASFLLFGISFLGLDIFKESEVDNIELNQMDDLEGLINSSFATEVKMDYEKIDSWKRQFKIWMHE